MGKIYSWFGGRKMFVFFLLLIINTAIFLLHKSFDEKFGDFCIWLGLVYMGVNAVGKFSGKNES